MHLTVELCHEKNLTGPEQELACISDGQIRAFPGLIDTGDFNHLHLRVRVFDNNPAATFVFGTHIDNLMDKNGRECFPFSNTQSYPNVNQNPVVGFVHDFEHFLLVKYPHISYGYTLSHRMLPNNQAFVVLGYDRRTDYWLSDLGREIMIGQSDCNDLILQIERSKKS